jgi:hypothetical protein
VVWQKRPSKQEGEPRYLVFSVTQASCLEVFFLWMLYEMEKLILWMDCESELLSCLLESFSE